MLTIMLDLFAVGFSTLTVRIIAKVIEGEPDCSEAFMAAIYSNSGCLSILQFLERG